MSNGRTASSQTAPMLIAAKFYDEIAARADEAEKDRKYPQDLVDRMAEAGLYRMCNPRDFGGGEHSAGEFAEVIEYLARADAAAAWVLFIGVSSMVHLSGFEHGAAEIMLNAPDTKAAGVFAPRGRAIAAVEDGVKGFRLSGQWQWGSGTQNSDWLTGGAFITAADGQLIKNAAGMPDQRSFAMRREQVEFIDTWHVSGLCGTGSTDFAVKGLFVPENFTHNFFSPRTRTEPVHGFPKFGFLAIGIAAVALGIARAAIDNVVGFAGAKTPDGARRSLALKSATQRAVGEAEGAVRAARLFFYDTIATAWAQAEIGDEVSIEHRRDLRLAMVHTVRTCAAAVDKMYDVGGGTSVYLKSPLQRHFRDINVATQHIMVAPDVFDLTGRLFLGVDTDTAML